MVGSPRGPLKGHVHAFPFACKPKAGATPYASESGYHIGSTCGEEAGPPCHSPWSGCTAGWLQIRFRFFLNDDYYDYDYCSAQAP